MGPFNKILVGVITLLCLALPAVPQEYSVSEIPNLDLLSDSYIYTIIQDSRAYLWFGTSNGLFRYDGFNLKLFTTNDSLADNFISCSYKSGNNLWFGHINGNLSFFDGSNFSKIIPENTDKSSITKVSGSSDGTVWASTFSGGILKVSPKSTKLYPLKQKEITIYTFRFVTNKTLLIGSADGLRYCHFNKNNEIEVLKYFSDIPRQPISSIVKAADNSGYYVAANNDGIYFLSFKNKTFNVSRIDKKYQPGFNDVQSMVEDNKGNLWLGTFGEGLFRVSLKNNKTIKEVYAFKNHISHTEANIKTIYQDRDENIWTGNYGQGSTRISAKPFSAISFSDKKYGNNVTSIVSDNKFNWISTEKGLVKVDASTGKAIAVYSPGNTSADYAITSFYMANKDSLWVGTAGKGLFMFNTKVGYFKAYPFANGNLENTVTSLTGFNNILWVGTKKGACRIDLKSNIKKWYTINKGGLPHNSIRQIYIDSKNRVWIVSLSSILSLIEGENIKKIPVPSSSGIVTLETIDEDKFGNIWAGSSGQGVFLIQHDSILNLTVKEGLFADYCYSLAADQHGFLWIGHRSGISRINCKNFTVKAIRKYADSTNIEFNNNAINCDKKGRIWFGYNHGILCYNPELENKRFLPPVVHIYNININNQDYAGSDKIKLVPGRYKIRFDFLGISLKEPDGVRYQYRLKGYDNEWSAITDQKSATYQGLTEGEYFFEVNASSSEGIITPKPASVIILIKSPLWKNIWLYIFGFLIMGSLIFIYGKRRERIHISEKRILEQKVHERTIEIQQQKDEIERQRDLINRKNVDITDSLKYARKIQSSIVPPDELLEKLFPDNFLISKPKDIVSGDFCWYTQTNDKTIVTVADCTGHGVPGAMMSILGVNALNEIVLNYGITEPSRILEFLRLKVISSLSQHSKDSPSFDGINLGLCVIDQKSLHIQFAGAINNMLHIQGGTLNLVKADRIPIGVSDLEHKPFTDTDFQGKKGDVIYLYSDGFQDQFGGERDKKFSSKKFISLLDDIHKEPMQIQKNLLEALLKKWMGDNEQTDDITILGFRL